MIMSIVRHPIRAKYADEWPELSAEFTTATRAEPGNICFDWFRSVDDPNVYLLVEMFRRPGRRRRPRELGPLQSGDGPDGPRLRRHARRSYTSRS